MPRVIDDCQDDSQIFFRFEAKAVLATPFFRASALFVGEMRKWIFCLHTFRKHASARARCQDPAVPEPREKRQTIEREEVCVYA